MVLCSYHARLWEMNAGARPHSENEWSLQSDGQIWCCPVSWHDGPVGEEVPSRSVAWSAAASTEAVQRSEMELEWVMSDSELRGQFE